MALELFPNHSFSNWSPCRLCTAASWQKKRKPVLPLSERQNVWLCDIQPPNERRIQTIEVYRSISLSRKTCYMFCHVMLCLCCTYVTFQAFKTSPDRQDIGLVARAFHTSTGWFRWVDLADVMLCVGISLYISMYLYNSMIFGQSGSTFTHQRSYCDHSVNLS